MALNNHFSIQAVTLTYLAQTQPEKLTASMSMLIFACAVCCTLHCPYAVPYQRPVWTILMCNAIGIDYKTAYPAVISAEIVCRG